MASHSDALPRAAREEATQTVQTVESLANNIPAHASRFVATQPTIDPHSDAERPQEQAVLTVEELASFLRVNHKTVREAIAKGEIPGVRRIGGTIRIYREAVIGWMASGQGRVSGSRRTR
jgi:excisionase family DNA binding protein